MATSPTQRTLAALREDGWTVAIVEKFNHFSKVRQDLYGIIDILAIGPRILGVQCTSGSNHAARVGKAMFEPRLRTWLEAGGHFQVWSWAKKGPRGKAKRWERRVEAITLEDLHDASDPRLARLTDAG